MKPLLVINLGSTSSKVGIFHQKQCIQKETIKHLAIDLAPYNKIMDQLNFRKEKIEGWIQSCGYTLDDFECFCVRGALIKPLESGIYRVNKQMIDEILSEVYASHVTNVGMVLGYLWSNQTGKECVFVNAPSTDELSSLARYTGIKGIERRTAFHALNQKQIALDYAQSVHLDVDQLKLIVVHLGGGISVGAHLYGKIVDVSNALDGEGCMSAERSGGLSVRNTIALYKTMNDEEAFFKLIAGKGGLISHTGSNDVEALLNQAKSDLAIKEIIDAMIYQIAKEIGAMATVLGRDIDAILITGGMAYAKEITDAIREKVDWIAKVHIFPGEDELKALAMGAYRYLEQTEPLKDYK